MNAVAGGGLIARDSLNYIETIVFSYLTLERGNAARCEVFMFMLAEKYLDI